MQKTRNELEAKFNDLFTFTKGLIDRIGELEAVTNETKSFSFGNNKTVAKTRKKVIRRNNPVKFGANDVPKGYKLTAKGNLYKIVTWKDIKFKTKECPKCTKTKAANNKYWSLNVRTNDKVHMICRACQAKITKKGVKALHG